jgi:hypothetical protein
MWPEGYRDDDTVFGRHKCLFSADSRPAPVTMQTCSSHMPGISNPLASFVLSVNSAPEAKATVDRVFRDIIANASHSYPLCDSS